MASNNPQLLDAHMARLAKEIEQVRWRGRIGMTAVVGAAAALVTWLIRPAIQDLAGETTKVDVSLILSVSLFFNLAVTVGGAFLLWWVRLRRGEVKRLRERQTRLEAELQAAEKETNRLKAALERHGGGDDI